MQVTVEKPTETDFALTAGAGRPAVAPGAVSTVKGQPPLTEDLRRLKNAALDQLRNRPAAEAAEAASEADADKDVEPRPREDIESVVLETPVGRSVEFGPVRMASFRVSEILGREAGDPYLQMLTRVMLGVRAIDGTQVKPVTNVAEAKILATKLGDESIDVLWIAMNEFWPPVTKKDLRVLKKNLR